MRLGIARWVSVVQGQVNQSAGPHHIRREDCSEAEGSSMVREVDPAEQREIPAVPVIPTLRSGNPPSSWYLAHGRTPGCIACEKGFKGRVHSVGCKERYKRWVEEQQGIPSRDEPHAPESDQRDVNLDVQGTEAAKPEVSPDSAGSGIVRDVPPVALREPRGGLLVFQVLWMCQPAHNQRMCLVMSPWSWIFQVRTPCQVLVMLSQLSQKLRKWR